MTLSERSTPSCTAAACNEIMAGYWPTADQDPSAPGVIVEYAEDLEASPQSCLLIDARKSRLDANTSRSGTLQKKRALNCRGHPRWLGTQRRCRGELTAAQSPVGLAFVRHRFLDDTEQAGIVELERFAGRNRMRRVERGLVLPGGVEIGEDAAHPVFGGVVHRRRPTPLPGLERRCVELSNLLAEAQVEPLDSQLDRYGLTVPAFGSIGGP